MLQIELKSYVFYSKKLIIRLMQTDCDWKIIWYDILIWFKIIDTQIKFIELSLVLQEILNADSCSFFERYWKT